MKTRAFSVLLAVLVAASSAALNAADDMLEYITIKEFNDGLLTGKLKEKTFYWGNVMLDTSLQPKSKNDGGSPYLEIEGGQSSAWQNSFIKRLVAVPAGKTKVVISVDLNYELNLWSPTPPPNGVAPLADICFTDGARVCAPQHIPRATKTGEWQTKTAAFPIPPGAKFLSFTFSAYTAQIARIRNINITFE